MKAGRDNLRREAAGQPAARLSVSMKHSEGGASKQTPIYVLVLGALIALNLLYFLSTHSKILEDVQAQQIGTHDMLDRNW